MSAPDLRQAQVLMTLAGLAYGESSELPRYLAEDVLTAGDYEPVFIPEEATPPDNFAFLSRSRITGNYTLAIRGTYPNPLSPAYWDDAQQDSPFGVMQTWPGSQKTGAKISAGTARAFQNVLNLSDGSRTLADAMQGLESDARLEVTGHSLGGTLAPVIALWLTGKRPDLSLTVVSFAGMTPGNLAFRSLFGVETPLSGRVFRFNNTLDTVGYGWDRVLSTLSFYRPHPRGGPLVQLLLLLTFFRLWFYGYKSIGTEKKLNGVLNPPAVKSELISYVIENLQQHLPSTYLALLGAPPLPFEIGYGSIVVERVSPTDAARVNEHRGRKLYYAKTATMHRIGL